MFSFMPVIFHHVKHFYDYIPIFRIKDLCDTLPMLTHDSIWLAIDRLAQNCGYSTSGLAKKAGLDPTAFNRSKRLGPDGKPRWPSTESIALILEATGSTMKDFLSFAEMDEAINSIPKKFAKMIPVLGYAQAGQNGFFDDAGYPIGEGWDMIYFPHAGNEDQAAYALEVSGDSMIPVFRHGDRLIVSPTATIRRGDRVVVKTQSGEVMAKELARQTASKIELKSLNPAFSDLHFQTQDILWMARIMWVSQ